MAWFNPVPVAALGHATAGSVLWTFSGQLHVALIVKAAFALREGLANQLDTAPELVWSDRACSDEVGARLSVASDVVPYRPRCDLWLTGAGSPPARRLLLLRDGVTLLDKQLALPASERRADFAPLALDARQGGRGIDEATRARLHADIIDVPSDVDWRVFQAAPLDQQTDYLRGDELMYVDGLAAQPAQIRCQLPSLWASARVWPRGGSQRDPGHPVAMVADTLAIDSEARRLTVTWRGSFPVPSIESLAALQVAAGLEGEGRPLSDVEAWLAAAAAAMAARFETEGDDLSKTVTSKGGEAETLALNRTLVLDPQAVRALTETGAPFSMAGPLVGAAPLRPLPIPGAPWAQGSESDQGVAEQEAAGHGDPLAATMGLDPSHVAGVATPFRPGNFEPPRSDDPAAPDPSGETIEALPPTTSGRQTVPFDAAPSGDGKTQPSPADGVVRPVESSSLCGSPPAEPPERIAPNLETMEATPAQLAALGSPLPFAHAVLAQPAAKAVTDAGFERRPANQHLPVVTLTPLQVTSVPWQVAPPQPSLTVVIKGTFDLVPAGPAQLQETCEPLTDDVHVDDDPSRDLVHASDFAIYKPLVDVTVTGSAYPPSAPAPVCEIGLRLESAHPGQAECVLERRVAAIGDRRWGSLGPSEPLPFESMPLSYERAYGGPGFLRNPLGRGHVADAQGVRWLPNLECPGELITSPGQKSEAACLAPLPPVCRAAGAPLGRYDAAWLRDRWPYFPPDFDYAHFQSAPDQQRLQELCGDESYLIWGARPGGETLRGQLPALRVRCFRDLVGELHEIVLKLDTCAFDLERLTLSLVWRAVVEVSDARASEIAALFVMVESLSQEPANAASVQAAYATARLELDDVEDGADGGAANDVHADSRAAAHLRRAEQQRADELRRAIPFGAAEPPSLPPPPNPAALARQLRNSGMAEADVCDAVKIFEVDDGDPIWASHERLMKFVATGGRLAALDLSGADLSGMDLRKQDLRGAVMIAANLERAQLTEADLRGAQLAGARLGGARLDGALLDDADLQDADLRGASLVACQLGAANLGGVRGDGAVLERARGAGCCFAEGHWTEAVFRQAELPDADFTEAQLDRAIFDQAVMHDIRLYDACGVDASFRGADLREARADGARLAGSNFEGLEAHESVWEAADLVGASFVGAVLPGASFVRARCDGALFGRANLRDGRFGEADLRRAMMVRANAFSANFEDADLSGADLRFANLYGAELWNAVLTETQLDDALLTNTKIER